MSDQTTVDIESRPREFGSFLLQINKGKSHDELTEKLRDLVAAVEETRKPGRLTYTLTVKPQERVEGAVVVADDVKVTTPTLDRPQSVFFVTGKGDLVRNDPRQPSMFDNITD